MRRASLSSSWTLAKSRDNTPMRCELIEGSLPGTGVDRSACLRSRARVYYQIFHLDAQDWCRDCWSVYAIGQAGTTSIIVLYEVACDVAVAVKLVVSLCRLYSTW